MNCPHCHHEMLVEKLGLFDTTYACHFCQKLYSVVAGDVEAEWDIKPDYVSPRWGDDHDSSSERGTPE